MAIQNKVTISEKDVSGYMQQRDNGEHLKIKSPSEYQDDIMSYFSDDVKGGIELPFVKTQEDFRIRMGELTIVSGYSGHGKTAWLSYCMLHLLKNHKTLIASFEMLPKATLGRMCMQTNNSDPTKAYIDDFISKIEHKLYLYDAEGETSTSKVLEVVYYAAEKLNVKMIVIDSLMKCGVNEDDLNGQKSFANKLAVAARDLKIHIFLVAHSRKTADENGSPSKFDVAGSANITNLADNSLSVHRNKKKEKALMMGEDPEEWKMHPDCTVYLNKQRHGNGTETYWGFYFCTKTFRYMEKPR
jgi:twinkle protein|tara:strand:+ start:9208 stop:10107 length:900 start_codon:yes stop_codon:yes gene_type:complete